MQAVKSTHRCEVVPVVKEPHPNADKLSIVRVKGYQVCVNTADWPDGSLGAYVVPDSVVDVTRPEFSFLASQAKMMKLPDWETEKLAHRIRVIKLRKCLSQGFLAPAPSGSKVGDDVAELLGVERYVPPCELEAGSDNIVGPDPSLPKYDVDGWHGHPNVFRPGEWVIASEKIHGASARYTFRDGVFYIGSRTSWKKQDAGERQWHIAAGKHPELRAFCEEHPDFTVYGEVYGRVKGMKYGHDTLGPDFVCFDIWAKYRWLSWGELFALNVPFPVVPILYNGPYDADKMLALAEGQSELASKFGASHIREGIVVRPYGERTDDEIGRVQLKIVSNAYHERGY